MASETLLPVPKGLWTADTTFKELCILQDRYLSRSQDDILRDIEDFCEVDMRDSIVVVVDIISPESG